MNIREPVTSEIEQKFLVMTPMGDGPVVPCQPVAVGAGHRSMLRTLYYP